ncbi:MAG: flagellar basal body rod protein FlgB [Bryobacterales bacterium]|nr:flagellar basal body rod protein FlgB [Bryobacterales bacterium]
MIDRVAQSLEVYLDLLATRQKLVASNIANLDTPGYRTRDVNFQDELASALSQTRAGQAAGRRSTSPAVTEVEGLALNNDGNNVNLDREARMLADNAMRFELGSALLASRYRTIRLAIKEGNS